MLRFRRHAPFAASVFVSVLLACINPALWPYVALGIGVAAATGLATWLLPRARRPGHPARSPTARAIVGAGLAAGIAAFAVSTLLSGEGDHSANSPSGAGDNISLELPVAYAADARYLSAGHEALRLQSRITITTAALATAARDLRNQLTILRARARRRETSLLRLRFPGREAEIQRRLRTTPGLRERLRLPPNPVLDLTIPDPAAARRLLSATLDRSLRHDGWTLETSNNRRQVRVRDERPQALSRAGFLPAERTNELLVSAPAVSDELGERGTVALDVSLTFEPGARVRLSRLPARAVGDTFPAATRARHPIDDTEDLAFPLGESGELLEFQVRSPPFRNPVLVSLVDLSLWSGVNWIVVLLIASTNDWVRALPGRLSTAIRKRGPSRAEDETSDQPEG